MVALDSASHDRAKQREQHAPDVFDVREADGPVRLRSDQNSRVPAKSQSAPTLPCHVRRRPGSTSPSLAFTFGDGLPGIASVSDTVLPAGALR
jgi:hypothetical protein